MSETVSNPEIDFRQRVDYANELLRTAQRSVDGLADTRIKGIFHFIQSADIGEPISDGVDYGIRKVTDRPAFIPLFLSDTKLHPYFKNIYESNQFTYTESWQTVFFKADANLSDNWKSILFLHESAHAWLHARNWWRDKPNDWSHWFEEHKVFELEAVIMKHITGKKYDMLLGGHAKLLEQMLDAHTVQEKVLGESNEFAQLKDMLQLSDDPAELGTARSAFMFAAFHRLQQTSQAGAPFFDSKADAHFIRYISALDNGKTPSAPSMPDEEWPTI